MDACTERVGNCGLNATNSGLFLGSKLQLSLDSVGSIWVSAIKYNRTNSRWFFKSVQLISGARDVTVFDALACETATANSGLKSTQHKTPHQSNSTELIIIGAAHHHSYKSIDATRKRSQQSRSVECMWYIGRVQAEWQNHLPVDCGKKLSSWLSLFDRALCGRQIES